MGLYKGYIEGGNEGKEHRNYFLGLGCRDIQ